MDGQTVFFLKILYMRGMTEANIYMIVLESKQHARRSAAQNCGVHVLQVRRTTYIEENAAHPKLHMKKLYRLELHQDGFPLHWLV